MITDDGLWIAVPSGAVIGVVALSGSEDHQCVSVIKNIVSPLSLHRSYVCIQFDSFQLETLIHA